MPFGIWSLSLYGTYSDTHSDFSLLFPSLYSTSFQKIWERLPHGLTPGAISRIGYCIINLKDDEVFVDCGAYIGDTIEKFIKICKGKYKKIIAFDADGLNLKKIEIKKLANVKCFNLGVWSKKDSLKFLQDNSNSSKLTETIAVTTHFQNETKQIEINVDAIDNIKECNDMTFLKMDIEGAELNALEGAEQTIRKNKPKLAISIYHSDADMINIPEWVVNLKMNYKIYIRHHFGTFYDTVLYAI